MLRYVTTIIFLTAFAAQNLQQAVIVFGYYTNTKAYAKVCENKAKPVLHCNGKCALMKKLKQEQKDEQLPERKAENKNEVVYSTTSLTDYALSIAVTTQQKFITVEQKAISGHHYAVFHPPCQA